MAHPSPAAGTAKTIPCDGRRITIEAFAPAGKDAAATGLVILLHDARGAGPDLPVRAEAAALAQAGFRVLLPHYFDRTGATQAGFSAIFDGFGPWRATVEAVLGWAREEGGATGLPIGLVGRSLGGALALAACLRPPEGVAALVVRSAFLPPELGAGPLALPPVLALHGGRDALVGPSHALRLRDRVAAAGGRAAIHLYEAQGHVFDADTEADAVARTIHHLRTEMARRPEPLQAPAQAPSWPHTAQTEPKDPE